jgi:vacuolar-type H+-ATPase subunit F/Vma7
MIKIRQLEIAVIGDEDLVSGLRLAGVNRYRIVAEGDREEIRRALTEFIDEPDVGIIVILEDYTEYIGDLVAQASEKQASPPVILEVPSKYGTRYKDVTQYYKAYIRRFIGFDIEI